jgi:hypothetical protein
VIAADHEVPIMFNFFRIAPIASLAADGREGAVTGKGFGWDEAGV